MNAVHNEREALIRASPHEITRYDGSEVARRNKQSRKLRIGYPLLLSLLFVILAGILIVGSYLNNLGQFVDYEIDGVTGVYPGLNGLHGRLLASFRLHTNRSWLLRQSNRWSLHIAEARGFLLSPDDLTREAAVGIAEPFDLPAGDRHVLQSLALPGVVKVIDAGLAARLGHAMFFADEPLVVPVRIEAKVGGILPFNIPFSRIVQVDVRQHQSSIPRITIDQLQMSDKKMEGIRASAVAHSSRSPVALNMTIPALSWDILVPGCTKHQRTSLTIVTNEELTLRCRKGQSLNAAVHASVQNLGKRVQETCDETGRSPLDSLLQEDAIVYIRGANSQPESTPDWLSKVLRDVELPVRVPRSHTQLKLDDLTVEKAAISVTDDEQSVANADVKGSAHIRLPMAMSLPDMRLSGSTAISLIYDNHSIARVHTRHLEALIGTQHLSDLLNLTGSVSNAQLDILSHEHVTNAVRQLLNEQVCFGVQAVATVNADTPLGSFRLHNINLPEVEVKFDRVALPTKVATKVSEMNVTQSSESTLAMLVVGQAQSPLPYDVSVKELRAIVQFHDTEIGILTAHGLQLQEGKVPLRATILFNRTTPAQKTEGESMLSSYLSGNETLVTLKAFEGSLPNHPQLGAALGRVPVKLEIPLPQLDLPTEVSEELGADRALEILNESPLLLKHKQSPFLVKASFHFFGSTASFVLRNPLNEPVLIDSLHAVATYHGSEVGALDFDAQFDMPEDPSVGPIVLRGDTPTTETPRLPVKWSARGLGRDALKAALGGTLTLNATASAVVRVGKFGPLNLNLTAEDVGAGVGF